MRQLRARQQANDRGNHHSGGHLARPRPAVEPGDPVAECCQGIPGAFAHSFRATLSGRRDAPPPRQAGRPPLLHQSDKPIGPGDEVLHVRAVFMAAIVLTPRQLALEKPGIHRWHFCGSIIFLLPDVLNSQQSEYRSSRYGGHVTTLLVQPIGVPTFGHTVANECEPKSAQRNQHMRVHREIAGILAAKRRLRSAILQEIARHPMVFARAGQVLDCFPKIATMQFCAAFTRRANQSHGKPRFKSHGDERSLAVARHAFDPDLLSIYSRVGFEIIQTAGGAPSPGA